LQGVAARFRPGEAGNDSQLVFTLHLAIAELAHARITADILRRHVDLLRLARNDLLHRLAGEIGDLPLEVAHPGFARVVADEIAQRAVGDRPFPILEAVRRNFLGD